jgi:hypothetical protein
LERLAGSEPVACRNSEAAWRRTGCNRKIPSGLRNMLRVFCFALGIVVMGGYR